MERPVEGSLQSEIMIFQTELSQFMWRRLCNRNEGIQTDSLQTIDDDLLDCYADALLKLFCEPPLLGTACTIVGVESVSHIVGGYSLRIKEDLSLRGTTQIKLLQIRPALIPLSLDLVSLALSVLHCSPSSAAVSITDGIYNLLKALVTLDRTSGDSDLIDSYEAFLMVKDSHARRESRSTVVTTEEILARLPSWPVDRLVSSLRLLEAEKILAPEPSCDDLSNPLSIRWREVW